jgi:serine/threonine protein kinase
LRIVNERVTAQQIGKYHVIGPLAAGGMGVIYRAVDPTLGRPVAIKAMRREFVSERKLVERFRNEAMALARLSHPHIAVLYEYLEDAGTHYMVMEYIDGLTLEQVVERFGPLAIPLVRAVFEPVLGALEYAHEQGIIHRDIKPSNIMIARHGSVKLTDFGIARLVDREKLTRTGQGLGSLPYMSPEQIRIDNENPPDARSDLYSLSVTLFEAVTGRMPFEAETEFMWMQAHLETPPPNAHEIMPGVPAALSNLIGQGMAKTREDRPESAGAYLGGLKSACGAESTTPPKAWFVDIPKPSFDTTFVPQPESKRGPTEDKQTIGPAPRRSFIGPLIGVLFVALLVAAWLLTTTKQEPSPVDSESTGNIQSDALPATTPDAAVVPPVVSAPTSEPGGTHAENKAMSRPPLVSVAPNLIVRVFPRSESESVQLVLDGIAQPAGMLEIDRVPPGMHEVTVLKENTGLTQIVEISSAGSKEFRFDFSRERGSLRVGFETTDGSLLYLADLYVDGRKTPKEAPVTLDDLPAGTHKVELRSNGYLLEGGPRIIDIKPSETAELFFRLKPAR